MDWSLIALLFAVGFALIGLGFLITTVHKVMSKPPPSQNIPPTPPPAPYLQPQQPPPPVYNWSLNGTRVQKLALGQGSSGSTAAPPPSTGGQIPGSGSEELESRLIPISYSVITPQIPVFEREPAHRATRVYEEPEPVPMPHSVAMPVDGDGLEPNAVATPASYFREKPVVQDVPTRKIKDVFNRAGCASSVASPVSPDGEARNFFRDREDVIEVSDVVISDSATPAESLETEIIPEKTQTAPSPEIISEPVPKPEPAPEPVPKPNPEVIPEPEPEAVPEPEPEAVPIPDRKPAQNCTAKSELTPIPQKQSKRKKKRKKQPQPVPIPNAPPAERVTEQEGEEVLPPKDDPVPKDEPAKGTSEPLESEETSETKPGPKERAEADVRGFIEKAAGRIPEPVRKVSGLVLICVCALICLLFVSLFIYFDKNPVVEEPPVVVDIPVEEPEPEPEPELEPVVEEGRYVMAMIGEQEAVSTTAEGFEPNFAEADYTNVPFYALTFAIQLDSDPGSEFQKIQVLDANTSEDLTATANSILHVYTGEVPSDAYFASHPVKSAPVVSSAVSDEIITCVFISLEKRSIDDLRVILSQANNGSDTLTEKEIMVNGSPDDLNLTPAYPMGSGLIKLGDQYYVVESGTGIGAVPDENKYVTRKIRCVSLPLTGSISGLEASSTALFDRQTGVRRELPAGTELYYREDYVEGDALMEIAFGIQLSGGSYEEAAAFLDSSFPGYIIDGRSIMF